MKQTSSSKQRLPRNPGPPLGYQLLSLGDRLLPHWLFYPMVKAGTIIAVLRMRSERHASRQYLRQVLGREPRFADILEHFYTQVRSLIRKITLKDPSDATLYHFDDPQTREFIALAKGGEQALFGTFHVGDSDRIGAGLCSLGRTVHMVRLQVRNSPDLAALKRVAGPGLEFVWSNNPQDIIFAINKLLSQGASLALQCDRPDFGSKQHVFRFLGAQRTFPVTIYYLSHMFQLPVGFALSVPAPDGTPGIISSGVFRPDPDSRKATLQSGYEHFQRTLDLLEAQLLKHPFIWFNFIPLNPAQESLPEPLAASRKHSGQHKQRSNNREAEQPAAPQEAQNA